MKLLSPWEEPKRSSPGFHTNTCVTGSFPPMGWKLTSQTLGTERISTKRNEEKGEKKGLCVEVMRAGGEVGKMERKR